MKYWLALVAPHLFLGAVSASNEISSECAETHTLPIITTTASALILTDLMPVATAAPGSNQSSGSGSNGQPIPAHGDDKSPSFDAGSHQTNVASPAGSQPGASGVSPGSGSGSGPGSDSASTPLPSDHPAYTSGTFNPALNIGRAVFVASSIALLAQIANLI